MTRQFLFLLCCSLALFWYDETKRHTFPRIPEAKPFNNLKFFLNNFSKCVSSHGSLIDLEKKMQNNNQEDAAKALFAQLMACNGKNLESKKLSELLQEAYHCEFCGQNILHLLPILHKIMQHAKQGVIYEQVLQVVCFAVQDKQRRSSVLPTCVAQIWQWIDMVEKDAGGVTIWLAIVAIALESHVTMNDTELMKPLPALLLRLVKQEREQVVTAVCSFCCIKWHTAYISDDIFASIIAYALTCIGTPKQNAVKLCLQFVNEHRLVQPLIGHVIDEYLNSINDNTHLLLTFEQIPYHVWNKYITSGFAFDLNEQVHAAILKTSGKYPLKADQKDWFMKYSLSVAKQYHQLWNRFA